MDEHKELAMMKEGTLTAADIRKQVNLIQAVMQEVMQEGEHYGKVPGTQKNTLFKSGAEKLAMTFRLAPDYEELPGSTEGDAFICYKINCRLTHIPTGKVIGNGRGTCNSKEKKYRTRAVYANKATEEEKKIGIKETRQGGQGSYDVYIIPQDPWDVQNTVYKMACKRALVAAVLNATAASDIFVQDIEDLPEGTVVEEQAQHKKPDVDMPQAADDVARRNMLAKFAKAKELIGEESYLNILGNNGIEKAEEIPSIEAGNKILAQMETVFKGKKKNGK